MIGNDGLRYGFRAAGENIRYCLDQKVGQTAAQHSRNQKSGRDQDKAYRDCGQVHRRGDYSLRKWWHKKGRDGASVPNIVTNGSSRGNNVKLDESCDFKVVSEGDAAARRHVR